MQISTSFTKSLAWTLALTIAALAAGCGGDGGGGGTAASSAPGSPGAAIAPGAACTVAAGPTIPALTSSNPTNGNLSVATSTAGVAGFGKTITATFSLPMDPATINSAVAGSKLTFQVVNNSAGGFPVAGTVLLNAAGTVAAFTTSAPLPPVSSFAAIISVAAKSAAGVAISCAYQWSFSTGLVSTSLAPINLGRVATFGSAATAGVTNTATAPNTIINGDVVLDPVGGATCNAVAIDAVGGFGLCAGSPPTIRGTVISPLFNLGVTSTTIRNDLLAAYLSITPPAGPPAAGSLGGATNLPAGTTLGGLAGSALVQGTNYFVAGVYQSTTSILVTGDLTLDGQNNPDATFIFQSSSTVGTAAGAASPAAHSRILLVNGAKASNVFWQAGTSATLGTFTEFQGNILSAASITLQTGATTCGRMLAGAFTAGAFVFDSNVVSVPGNANAPVSCQ